MSNSPKLNWLAERACNILEKNVGKNYANEKREQLHEVDRFKVIIWLNNLDKENLKALARL